MADTKISALPSATPASGDQFPFVSSGITSRASYFTSGTWTPVLNRATTSPTITTYNAQQGRYVKIGPLVFASFNIDYTGTSAAGSGANQLTGLPFTSASSTSGMLGVATLAFNDGFSTTDTKTGRVPSGVSFIRFSAGGRTQADLNEDYTSSGRRFISGAVVYEATS